MSASNSLSGSRPGLGWSIIGHDPVIRLLDRALTSGRLAHAYLLVGPPHVGKGTLAMNMAQAVNCQEDAPPCRQCSQCRRIAQGQHTDVQVLGVEEVAGHKSISIDTVRDLQRQAYLKPFEGRSRVIIIDGAEFLSDPAANAILKLLEEPPPQVLMVLLAADADLVLPTILSRCHLLRLRPLPKAQVMEALETRWEVPSEEAKELARLSRGCIGWAIRAREDPELLETQARRLERLASLPSATLEERFAYAAELAGLIPQHRTAVRETLDLWCTWWRDLLVAGVGAEEAALYPGATREATKSVQGYTSTQLVQAIRAVQRTEELLDLNVNPRLALEELLLNIPEPTQGDRP